MRFLLLCLFLSGPLSAWDHPDSARLKAKILNDQDKAIRVRFATAFKVDGVGFSATHQDNVIILAPHATIELEVPWRISELDKIKIGPINDDLVENPRRNDQITVWPVDGLIEQVFIPLLEKRLEPQFRETLSQIKIVRFFLRASARKLPSQVQNKINTIRINQYNSILVNNFKPSNGCAVIKIKSLSAEEISYTYDAALLDQP